MSSTGLNDLNEWFDNNDIEILETKIIESGNNDWDKYFILYKKVGRKEKLENLNQNVD